MTLAPTATPAKPRRRRRRNLTLTIGIVVTVAFIAMALASFFYLPHNPNVPRIPDRLLPAGSPGYLLGTDALGRDIFSQLMVGARTSLLVGAGGGGTALEAAQVRHAASGTAGPSRSCPPRACRSVPATRGWMRRKMRQLRSMFPSTPFASAS